MKCLRNIVYIYHNQKMKKKCIHFGNESKVKMILRRLQDSHKPLRELRCQRITMRVVDTRMCQRQRGKRSSMAIKITIRSPQT